MSETEILANFAAELKLEDVPPSTVARSKIVFLDGLACMLAGIRSPLGEGSDRVFGAEGGIPEATLIVSGKRGPARNAAFVNAMALYSVGLNDIHKPSGTHPGGSILPAVLATAEQAHASGKELLTGLIAGYEINGRIGRAVKAGHRARGFHPTGTCGTFGAAAGCARVLKRDRDKMINVLGIAGSQASGLYEFHSTGSTTMIYHAARASQNGVEANLMLDAGVTGPETVLEGRQGFFAAMSETVNTAQISRELGSQFMIDEVSLRPIFGCNSTKSTSTALAGLLRSKQLAVADVEQIEIHLNPLPAHDNDIPAPNSLLAARLSVQFNAGLIMDSGDVLVRDVTEADLNNPSINKWLEKVVVKPDESLSRYACKITVKRKDGSTVSAKDAGAKGDPADPLKWDAVIRKFARMVELPVDDPSVTRLAASVDALETTSTTTLIDHLMNVRGRALAATRQP
jgi:2-methylcitrate dehydratase PrpD